MKILNKGTLIGFAIGLATVVGLVAATGNRVLTTTDTAYSGSVLTHQWVNAVNLKANQVDAASCDTSAAIDRLTAAIQAGGIGGGGGGTTGKTFIGADLNQRLLHTNETALAFCKTKGYANATIKSSGWAPAHPAITLSIDGINLVQETGDSMFSTYAHRKTIPGTYGLFKYSDGSGEKTPPTDWMAKGNLTINPNSGYVYYEGQGLSYAYSVKYKNIAELYCY